MLVDGAYQPIPLETGDDGVIRGYSPALGLELHWQDRRLRFWNRATQAYLPDLVEALATLTEAQEEIRQLRAELQRQQNQS